MPTVIWQSETSFDTKFTIFQETITMALGQRVFADHNYAYALLPEIYRVAQGSGIERNQLNITPSQLASGSGPWVMGHYLNLYGQSVASAAMTAETQVSLPLASGNQGGPTQLFTSLYAEFADSWITQSGYADRSPVDIASPDFPDNPRFLIGWAGDHPSGEKVTIVPIVGDVLGTRLATNWTTLSNTAQVTDLESVRII